MTKQESLMMKLNYLNRQCGIPATTISKATGINYQHLLNVKNGKNTLKQTGLDNLELALNAKFGNYLDTIHKRSWFN